MSTLVEPSVITEEQRLAYERDGYLLLAGFVGDGWLARLREAADRFVERSRSMTRSDKVLDLEPGHTAEQPRLRRLISPVDHDEAFRSFALEGPAAAGGRHPGRYGRYHHSKLNYKASDGGAQIDWHQDIQFWPHTDFTPLTIGVYLDDVDDQMGPMGIVPRSHTGEAVRPVRRRRPLERLDPPRRPGASCWTPPTS
ncbi:MAG: phytanoyl-CoA dioxygenase family protein [Acidimicrobiales bacterium]